MRTPLKEDDFGVFVQPPQPCRRRSPACHTANYYNLFHVLLRLILARIPNISTEIAIIPGNNLKILTYF
jgi:hypothetical protein